MHTKGPWRVDPRYLADVQTADGRYEIAVTSPDALLDGKAPNRPECHANARLIAASPELLRCIEFVAAHFEDRGETVGNRAYAFCKEVIAKAKGETK